MRRIGLFLLFSFMVFLLTGCFKIPTPEDLLASPELKIEKKEMKEAVDKFRPNNSTDYAVSITNEKKSVYMLIKDLDSDQSTEIISFYKNNSDNRVGMFILKKIDALWVKKIDILFDSVQIDNLTIMDLNNDNKKEIIVELYETGNKSHPRSHSIIYFDDKDVKSINIPHIIMGIFDINLDEYHGYKEIFYITANENRSEYFLNIDFFNGKSMESHRKRKLKNIKNPYNMVIGKLYESQMALFIDYMGENYYENTMIWLFEKGKGELFEPGDGFRRNIEKYSFNLQSKDIDNDEIIEVGYKFKSPNYLMPVTGKRETGLVNGYFKINKDGELELSKEIYEEYSYIINFPKEFKGRYSINVSESGIETNINFINHLGKEYPLIKIEEMKKYDWQKGPSLKKEWQLIFETQENVIVGRLMDYSESLDGKDKDIYNSMRESVSKLSNIIKEKNY